MSRTQPEGLQIEKAPPHSYPVLEWVMCHPGVLMFSSIALGTLLAARRQAKPHSTPERRVETEADVIDGDVPLFV